MPAALGREGRAMRDALIADLSRLGHRVVASVDPRFPVRRPPRGLRLRPPQPLQRLLRDVDAVWLIAPETGRCLERLAARVVSRGLTLLGSSPAALRRASDKSRLPALLRRAGVPHPATRVLSRPADAAALGFPAVIKPARGAGCEGVRLVRRRPSLALEPERRVVQAWVPGVPASVSLLANGRDAVVLAVHRQRLRGRTRFSYLGGVTPFDHPLAARAAAHARAACRAIPGLRGYVGVDVVLGDTQAWVIEINPRLTTSYLGLRSACDRNVAGLAIAACAGRLPRRLPLRRRVGFSASGRIRAMAP